MNDIFSSFHKFSIKQPFYIFNWLRNFCKIFLPSFSMMKFSTEPELWNSSLVEPNEEKCKEAIEWISEFEAYGGTCTIDALRVRSLIFW